jgi:hypothetical protein
MSPGIQDHLKGGAGAGAGFGGGAGGGGVVRVGFVLGETLSRVFSSFFGVGLKEGRLGASWNRAVVSGFSVTRPGALGLGSLGFGSGG